MSSFLEKLHRYTDAGWIPERHAHMVELFYESYKHSLESHGVDADGYLKYFHLFLDFVKEQIASPYSFPPYHVRVRSPVDYYAFGVEFLRPLVDMSASSVEGLAHVDEIASHLRARHNVILLANHQTEADPQAISILLERTHPQLAEEMIFVAGERVLTDPLAIPFSMGRNLLCIYSKRYIDHPPEQKLKKQLHNKRTMELMSELLSAGGQCIYVAPSGGRDRPNQDGVVEVAPFDPQSIEMFALMAQRAAQPTYFYPLALATYDLLPPPETIQIELGETRQTKRGGIHLAFGARLLMDRFPGGDVQDKHARRKARADYIWKQVHTAYVQLRGSL
jgi:glycerol-3-phosphate O-acyltransferase